MQKKKRLYQTLFFIILLLIYLCATIGIWYSFDACKKNYFEITDSHLDAAEEHIESYLENYSGDLEGIGQMELTHNVLRGNTQMTDELLDIVGFSELVRDDVENVFFIRRDRSIAAATMGVYEEFDPKTLEYIDRAELGTVIASVDENSFDIIAPVFDKRELLGFIMAELDRKALAGNSSYTPEDEGTLLIIDDKNDIMGANDRNLENLSYDEIKNIKNTVIKKGHYFIGGRDIHLESTDISWRLLYVLSAERVYDLCKSYTAIIVFLCIILLALFILINIFISKYVERPLEHISGELENLKKRNDYTSYLTETGLEDYDNIIYLINSIIGKMVNGDMAVLSLVKKYANLFREKRIIFLEWDLINFSYSVTPQYKEIFGVDFELFWDKEFSPEQMGIHPEDAAAFNEWIKEVRSGRELCSIVCRRIMPDGKYRYFEYVFSAVKNEMGESVSALGYIMDVNRYVRTEIGLRRAAELDRYTGAYNKYAFIERLKKRFKEVKTSGEDMCVSIIKLHNYYRLEDERVGLGEEGLRFIYNVISENIDCTIGRILSDGLGIFSTSKDMDFLSKEIAKELDLGFVSSENKKRYFISSTSALLTKDKLNGRFEDMISACVKEYENFKDNDCNDFYLVK